MLDKTRIKKKVIANAPKKKGRFGGSCVILYLDPFMALRAYGAKIRERDCRYGKDGYSWDVPCPLHNGSLLLATLTHRNDHKWQFTCRRYDCGNGPGENKLEMLSRIWSLDVSNFTAESNLDIVCEDALMMRRLESRKQTTR